jgi:hypothetical protein
LGLLLVPSLPGTEALDDKMKYLADFGSLHPVPEGTEGTEGGAVDRHVNG